MNNLVLKYLENSCNSFKEKVAFADQHNSVTFGEVRHFSMAISNAIINKIGYTNNQPILIYLPKSIEAIISMFGIVYSGNFYTPTNVDFPTKKILDIINVLSPCIIITNSTNKSKILDLGFDDKKIIYYDEIDFNQDISDFKDNTKNAIDTDIVYTYFTSGSTGIPKGVTINHKNIIDYIEWACEKFPINEKTVFGNQSALYFDISTQDIYATLKKGSTMIIIPEGLFTFPIKAAEFIREKNINFLYWVPSAYVNFANFKALDNICLEQVKAIMFGGEVMPTKHLNYFQDKLPNLSFIANVYGPTEATVNSTYYIVDRAYKEEEPLPLGSMMENKRVFLLDEHNKLVKEKKKIGEICVAGTSVSPGYYRNFEKTKEVFIQNPLHDDFQDIIYCTGDLAMYDDEGLLVFCGRKDNQIKHLGYRIELGEIETAVLSLKKIDNCVVFYDEKRRRITLLYVSEAKNTTDREIKLGLANILPKYMLPTKYYKLDTLPLNNNGKIDRFYLKKKYT